MKTLLLARSLVALSLITSTTSFAQPWKSWEADSSSQAGAESAPSSWEEVAERGARFPSLPPLPLRSHADHRAMLAEASSGYEAEWVPIWLPDPTRREDPAGIVDPVRNRLVFFGGYDGQYQNDAWALSLGDTPVWTRLEPEGLPPPPRDRHSAVYDPVGDRMIIYGGYQGTETYGRLETLNDVWALELAGSGRWVQLHPAGVAAPHRAAHATVYDSRRRRILIHGGTSDFSTYGNDLWALSLENAGRWDLLLPTGSLPLAMGFHAAAYDSAGDRVLLARTGVIYSLSLGGMLQWSKLDFSTKTSRSVHSMVCDGRRNRLVLHTDHVDSSRSNLWAIRLEPPHTWQALASPGDGPGAWQRFAALDRRADRLISFGGGFAARMGEPWAFALDSGTWSPLADIRLEPPGAIAIAYDPDRHRVVAMGCDAAIYTMALSGPYRWHGPFFGGRQPVPRSGYGIVYDAAERRFILHGGYRSGYNGHDQWMWDTWALSAVEPFRWDSLVTDGSPNHGVQAFGMALDPVLRRIAAYGGTRDWDGDFSNAAGALDLEPWLTWRGLPRDETIGPGQMSDMLFEYDPDGDRMLLFGGYKEGRNFSDLWSLTVDDSARWGSVPVSGLEDLERRWWSWIPDPSRHRMLLRGHSTDGTPTYGELWSLNLGAAASITPLLTSARIPPPEYIRSGVHDPLFDRFILNAGITANANPTNWWELRLHAPTPITIALASATTSAEAIIVEWRAPALNARCTVERRDGDAEWRAIGSIVPRGDGVLRWEDLDVVAGTLYRYRLHYSDRDGDQVAGETGDLALASLATSIAMAGPHPVRDVARIRLSLTSSSSAELDVVDIAGRVVGEINLTGLGPGEREVEWRDASALESGLYFLRLRDGGTSRSTRMIVVR